jgi:hypothetical protein
MPRWFLWMTILMKSTSCVNIMACFWVAVSSCCSSVRPSLPMSLAENACTPRLFRPSTMAMLTLSSA